MANTIEAIRILLKSKKLGKYVIPYVDKIEKDGDGNVIADTYLKIVKLNTSKMYTTGEVSEDEQGFNQLQQMRHSTFDLSKFTVVGSPTVTDNGVASGFSATNYIKIPGFPTIKDNITIFCKFNSGYKETSATNFLFGWYHSENLSYFRFDFMSNSVLRAGWRDKNSVISGSPTNIAMQTNSDHTLKVILTNAHIECYLDGNLWFSKDAELDFSHLKPEYFTLGTQNAISTWFLENGSIDLSQFSVKVDGKEVFNGNRTGIDVIKPDNYTVVGSPTITSDGIASGFSSSNYLTTTQSLGNSIKVFTTFKTPQSDNVTANSAIWQIKTSPTIELQVIGQKLYIINSGGNVTAGNFDFEYDTWYDTIFEYNFTTGAYKLSYKKSVDNNYIELTGTQSGWVNMSLSDIVIDFGTMNRYYWYTGGSIDLNSFKIYVDGSLVYQPCLKIPYTESKSGSKIVDVAYRDRVIDLYEQQGLAGYYTIDEKNKNLTLPMGEIYGLIESKADKASINGSLSLPSKTIEVQTVGASGSTYKAPANGYYCGKCTEGGAVLENKSNNNFGIHSSKTSFAGGKAFLPCLKNDVISFSYDGTSAELTFYYAEGDTPSESEV